MRKILVFLLAISFCAIITSNAFAKLPTCKYDPYLELTAEQLKEAADTSQVSGVITGPLFRNELEAEINAACVPRVIAQPLLSGENLPSQTLDNKAETTEKDALDNLANDLKDIQKLLIELFDPYIHAMTPAERKQFIQILEEKVTADQEALKFAKERVEYYNQLERN